MGQDINSNNMNDDFSTMVRAVVESSLTIEELRINLAKLTPCLLRPYPKLEQCYWMP